MSKDNDYVDVTEAARLLGVTTRQVRRLGEKGEILVPFRGVVDRGSIERHLSDRGFSRRRSWDEHTCWAAIALLSGLEVDWLGDVQTSRLRGRLRRMASDEEQGAHDLIGRARGRATVHTFEAFDFITSRVKKTSWSSDAAVLTWPPPTRRAWTHTLPRTTWPRSSSATF